ncbi:hypothetical protein PCASD_18021 [Puccinia coronata f. sp. avenae]|uniref:Uncharacterized protein n=1 Tax=Puccinia coronata f. sp. avenae TaxID=200324 RepID=A0A2N5UC40_9BASI|nr:hypothetical protein PCASD_18021 [Puccinia coronata f. sp. avenae]
MRLDQYTEAKLKKATKAQYQRWRKKIREARCKVADGVFRNNHQLAVVLEDKDCHSDIEDAPGNVPPVSLFPPWRSLHLTQILHHLDSMAQDQATHYKTIKTNNQVYGRSARNHGKYVGGTTEVAQNWRLIATTKLSGTVSVNTNKTLYQLFRQSTFNKSPRIWERCAERPDQQHQVGRVTRGQVVVDRSVQKIKGRRMVKGLRKRYQMGLWWLISIAHF